MSSEENEDPIGQFDAFRARRAEERAQQETQTAYIFPPEYAAQPGPVFEPTGPPVPRVAPANRTRSILVFVGAVLVVGVLGLGAWLAFGSSATPSASASPGSARASASPTARAGRALAFRVTIVSLGGDSFTGTVLANGATVTVALTGQTRFGTRTHPFSRSDLRVGETVVVRGRRTGPDTVTATEVAQNVRSSA